MSKVLKIIVMIVIISIAVFNMAGRVQATGIEPRTIGNGTSDEGVMPISEGQGQIEPRAPEGPQTTSENGENAEKKGNVGLAVGIGIGAVAVIGLLIFWYIRTN